MVAFGNQILRRYRSSRMTIIPPPALQKAADAAKAAN
jgi:hypothetical protein